MAIALANRVKETSTTTGTGAFSLAGASSRFKAFIASLGDDALTYYCIEHQTLDEWEVGKGTLNDATPDTLTRTEVYEGTNGTSPVNFSAGTKNVFCTLPADRAVHSAVGGVQFDPADSTWVALVDPNDIVGSDGDAQSSVPSGGTAGAFAQATGANQPLLKKAANGINGHNVLLFDGSNDRLTATTGAPADGDFYMAAVVEFTAISNYQTIIAWGDESNGERREMIKVTHTGADPNNNGAAFNGFNADVNTPAPLAIDTPYLIEITRSSTTVTVYVNGQVRGSDTPTLAAFASTAINLGTNNAGTEPLNAKLGFAAIMASVPSAAVMSGFRWYLADRFGIDVGGADGDFANSIPVFNASNELTNSGITDDGDTVNVNNRRFKAHSEGNLQEHVLIVSGSVSGGFGLNVLRLQQTNPTGFSCVYGCGYDVEEGVEGYGFACGWGNALNTQAFGGRGYFEVYNALSTDFYPYAVVQTNSAGNYRRYEATADGPIVEYSRSAVYPNEQVVAVRGVSPANLANDAVLTTIIPTGVFGIVVVASHTDGLMGIYRINASAVGPTVAAANALFTLVKDNAGTINIYVESGFVKVQNKTGSTKSLAYGLLGI